MLEYDPTLIEGTLHKIEEAQTSFRASGTSQNWLARVVSKDLCLTIVTQPQEISPLSYAIVAKRDYVDAPDPSESHIERLDDVESAIRLFNSLGRTPQQAQSLLSKLAKRMRSRARHQKFAIDVLPNEYEFTNGLIATTGDALLTAGFFQDAVHTPIIKNSFVDEWYRSYGEDRPPLIDLKKQSEKFTAGVANNGLLLSIADVHVDLAMAEQDGSNAHLMNAKHYLDMVISQARMGHVGKTEKQWNKLSAEATIATFKQADLHLWYQVAAGDVVANDYHKVMQSLEQSEKYRHPTATVGVRLEYLPIVLAARAALSATPNQYVARLALTREDKSQSVSDHNTNRNWDVGIFTGETIRDVKQPDIRVQMKSKQRKQTSYKASGVLPITAGHLGIRGSIDNVYTSLIQERLQANAKRTRAINQLTRQFFDCLSGDVIFPAPKWDYVEDDTK